MTRIELPGIYRDKGPDQFADITIFPFVVEEEPVIGTVLVFEGDLSREQQQDIVERAMESPNDTILKKRVRDAYVGLTQIETSTGNLTIAQISNALRLQAKVIKALGREIYNDKDSTD